MLDRATTITYESGCGIRNTQLSAVRWGSEPMSLSAKKLAKMALASSVGRSLVATSCRVSEAALGDSVVTRRAYRAAVAIATYRGVSEGLARYGQHAAAQNSPRIC